MTLPFTHSHAFIIGINEYQSLSNLNTAVADAQALGELLKAAPHNYTLHGPTDGLLLNPNKVELVKFLEETMMEVVKASDRVLIYFAGHGIALQQEEGEKPNGYLVPTDAKPGKVSSLYSMFALQQVLNDLPCAHGILILDCCYSGAFRWSTFRNDFTFDLPAIIYEQRFYQYAKDPAWQVITSTASDQKAADLLEDDQLELEVALHSPFAKALLDGLAGAADVIPKEKGDGVITTTELYSYLRNRVEDETMNQSRRQSPGLFSLKKHDSGQYIFFNPKHPLNLPPLPKRNPYLGIAPYQKEDAALFFGREIFLTQLITAVENHRFILLSGASSSGKSSLIQAGLLPALGEKEWNSINFSIETIEEAEELVNEIKALLEEQLIASKKNLLIIDGYEKILKRFSSRKILGGLESELSKYLKQTDHLCLLISIRSDSATHFEENILTSVWKETSVQLAIPPISNSDLRSVVLKPSVQEVLFFQPQNLVETLVDTVEETPGALCVLSIALKALYEEFHKSGRTNRSLLATDFAAFGGIGGLLVAQAEEVFSTLNEMEQTDFFWLILRLLKIESGQLNSQRVTNVELEFEDPDISQNYSNLVDKLVAVRLLQKRESVSLATINKSSNDTTSFLGAPLSDELNPFPFSIEFSHPAIISEKWTRFQNWMEEIGGISQIALHHKLAKDVREYQAQLAIDSNNAKSILWDSNPKLDAFYQQLLSNNHPFNRQEVAFLKESIHLRAELQAGALLLKSHQEVKQDATLALDLAMQAYKIQPTEEICDWLKDLWSQAEYKFYQEKFSKSNEGLTVESVAFSEDGQYLIFGGYSRFKHPTGMMMSFPDITNMTVELMATENGKWIQKKAVSFKLSNVLTILPPLVKFSKEKQVVLIMRPDGIIEKWNFKTGKTTNFPIDRKIKKKKYAGKYNVDKKGFIVAAFANIQPYIAVSYYPYGQVVIWDYEKNKLVRDFSVDPKVFLENNPTVEQELTDQVRFSSHQPVQEITFSPDDKYLLTGDIEAQFKVWDLRLPYPLLVHNNLHNQGITAVKFSNLSNTFLVGDGKGAISSWDIEYIDEAEDILFLEGHQHPITAFEIAEKQQKVLTADSSGLVHLWGVSDLSAFEETGLQILYTYPTSERVLDLSLSPDGQCFATSQAGDIRLWQVFQHKEVTTLVAHFQEFAEPKNIAKQVSAKAIRNRQLAFNSLPSGVIGSVGENGKIVLWETENFTELSTFKLEQKNISAKAVSPNKTFLIAVGNENTLIHWDLEKQELINTYQSPKGIKSIVIGADNESIYLAQNTGEILFGNIADFQKWQLIKKETLAIHHLAISPDGRYLFIFYDLMNMSFVTYEITLGIQFDLLEETTQYEFRGHPLKGNSNPSQGINKPLVLDGHKMEIVASACSPDGQFIATGGRAGYLLVRSIKTGEKLWEIHENKQELLWEKKVIQHLKFSSDGSHLLSTDILGNLYLRNAKTGYAIFHINLRKPIASVTFSADNRYLIIGLENGTLKVWQNPIWEWNSGYYYSEENKEN